MDELTKLIAELTESDNEMLAGYEQDIHTAKKDLLFHREKIDYYKALIDQRQGFVNKLRAKLKRISNLKSKLIKNI